MVEQRPRVLVVDDDESIRGIVEETLSGEGYEVRVADNGRSALGVLSAWQPDLIILDLIMPDMGGWSFREEQLKLTNAKDIPVLILSGARRLPEQAESLHAAGYVAKPPEFEATAFLPKPFGLDALISSVKLLAGAPATTPEPTG